jgi:type I restriction-modification system DNA methylase subunit
LKELGEKLNRYLADTYGLGAQTQWKSKKEKENAYQEWKESHRPFHWFAEFYEIIRKGGFDVVIGNPPYVEYTKAKNDYSIKGYETESCGNLYVFVMERSCHLLNENSYFGMIIPLSICCGDRMFLIRKYLSKQLKNIHLSNFEIFPSKLFEGAFQRITIITGEKGGNKANSHSTSKLYRWYSIEREGLIDKITYTPVDIDEKLTLYGKFQSPIHLKAIEKIGEFPKTIAHFCIKTHPNNFIYYQEATNYWMKSANRIPFYKKK